MMYDTLFIYWTASKSLRAKDAIKTGRAEPDDRLMQIPLVELDQATREKLIEFAEAKHGLLNGKATPGWWIDLRTTQVMLDKPRSYEMGQVGAYCEKRAIQALDQPLTINLAIHMCQEIKAKEEEVMAQAKELAQAYREKVAAEKEAQVAAEIAEFDRQLEIYLELLPKVKALVAGQDLEAIEAFSFPEGYNRNFPTYRPMDKHASRFDFERRESLSSMLSERKKELKAAAKQAEIDAWIGQFGSQYLKLARAGGYELTRLYVLERFAYEIGEPWQIDFCDTARWDDRMNPTMSELQAEQEAKQELGDKARLAGVVWLTASPSSSPVDGYYDEVEPGPALVARGYLNKYNLIKML